MTMRTTAFLTNEAAPYIQGAVLDVGAGDAPYKRLFAPLVESWTSTDARPVADIEWNLDDPPPESLGEYDTVICTDTLQFVKAPVQAVWRMAHHLKPGGHLILSVPNCWHEDQTARWRVTIGGLGEMVSDAGLSTVYLDGLTGLFEMESENAHMIGEYTSSIPATFRGFISAMDRLYPMLSVCIARKD